MAFVVVMVPYRSAAKSPIRRSTIMSAHGIRLSHLLAFVALTGLAAGDLSAQRGGRGGGGGARAGGPARSSAGTHSKGTRSHHSSASSHRGGTQRTTANRSSTHRTTTASNNRGNGNRVNNGNINTGDVNVNVNGNGYGHGYGYGYHPVARGVVAGATTAAIMGHYYNALPSGCATVHQNGMVYHQCGSTWYRTDGNQYVVVQHP